MAPAKHPHRPIYRLSASGIAALAAMLLASCAHQIKVAELPAPLPIPEMELEAAQKSWAKISAGNRSDDLRDRYNESVSKIVRNLEISSPGQGGGGLSVTLKGQPIPVIDRMTELSDLPSVESIEAADLMLITGFRERVEEEGIGAPIVLHFPPEGYSPREGRFQPATAILDFEGAHHGPRLVIHDPLSPAESKSLRSNFTAPLAARFAAEERQRINLPAMLRNEKFNSRLGLSQIDAIYPEKIPVVFVHGLKSAPNTWRDVMNELRADPLIRDRYEFWTFGYATGVPIPYSAKQLREALKGMATYRNLQGAETNDMVLIGHSMGGLLSRLMTERSGDDIWFEFFNEPVDELPVSEEKRELLRKMAYFEPLPFVKRAVFIATPHGGSQIADDTIGQVASGLIRLPNQLLTLSTTILTESLYALTPNGMSILMNGLPTSINQLESESEILKRLKAQPLNPNVTFHSIIGDQGKGLGPESSDGVVPYTSSHIEGTASEAIIPSGHRAHHHPDAIPELIRILRLHVGG